MTTSEFKVCSTPKQDFVYTNCVYLNSSDFARLTNSKNQEEPCHLVQILAERAVPGSKNGIYRLKDSPEVLQGHIAFNALQRSHLRLQLDQIVKMCFFTPPLKDFLFEQAEFAVSRLTKSRSSNQIVVDCKELAEEILHSLNKHVLEPGQKVAHKHKGSIVLQLELRKASCAQFDSDTGYSNSLSDGYGQILSNTSLDFVKGDASDPSLKLVGKAMKKSANQMVGVDFEKLGIGGLDKEFTQIFRRAFASRIFPPEVVARLGTKHVKGLMLYGPPGCGKTLIARQISRVLQGEDNENSREPKIVSGPEVLNKYVGGSEEKIRELFKEAEEEQAALGDESELHVIIFDEIDAICKSRGSKRDSTGVGDSIVNQLLSKIDGVNMLNNILLIGMTNRLDLIDRALLRPGRFEVHIEIGLPDETGRVQILNIHTSTMRKSNSLGNDVDITTLAKQTKNFSGAEIEGLVKSASSFAFLRHVGKGSDLTSISNLDSFKVRAEDFENALSEVKPSFGVQGEDELQLFYRNGIVDYGETFRQINETLLELAKQVETSERTPLLSVLLAGKNGSGKSAIVAKMATLSGFPFIKMVTADSMIGMHEQEKSSKIVEIFENAYKSPLSLIIIDDIERLIDYVALGPRFSNQVLQALLVLINKAPPKENRKLMVIGTTAIPGLLDDLGLTQVFNVTLNIPLLETIEEIEIVLKHMLRDKDSDSSEISDGDILEISSNCKRPIAIKQLLVVLEMARQNSEKLTFSRFMHCLHSVGF